MRSILCDNTISVFFKPGIKNGFRSIFRFRETVRILHAAFEYRMDGMEVGIFKGFIENVGLLHLRREDRRDGRIRYQIFNIRLPIAVPLAKFVIGFMKYLSSLRFYRSMNDCRSNPP